MSKGTIPKKDLEKFFKETMIWEPLRDPVYDYIEYDERLEEKIIDTEIVQRLRRLHQLQVCEFVYPGAVHTRFLHSLGAMHLSGLLAERILTRKEEIKREEREYLTEVVRISGLLHDIGHGPYSHAFDEYVINSKEGKEELAILGIESHENLAPYLIDYSEIGDLLESCGLKKPVLKLLGPEDPSLDPVLKGLRGIIKRGLYPADIIDFVVRDAYFTGTREYGYVDVNRLIRSSSLDGTDIVIDERALTSCTDLLYARFQMFENVYYHRTRRALDYMVGELLKRSIEDLNLIGRIKDCVKGKLDGFLELDDYSILFMVIQKANEKTASENIKQASRLALDLMSRKLKWRMIAKHKLIYTRAVDFKLFDLDKALRLINDAFSERLKTAYGEKISKDIPILIDHTKHKFIPDNPYEMRGILKVCLPNGDVEERDLFRTLLEYYPMFFRTFRLYTSEDVVREYPEIRALAEQALRSALYVTELGITM